jgi:hypothetical protein
MPAATNGASGPDLWNLPGLLDSSLQMKLSNGDDHSSSFTASTIVDGTGRYPAYAAEDMLEIVDTAERTRPSGSFSEGSMTRGRRRAGG